MVNLIDILLVLSYCIFSRLLEDATPRQDLQESLSRMDPFSIFKPPTSTYDRRSKGAYYLIPLLRQLEHHVVGYLLVYVVFV